MRFTLICGVVIFLFSCGDNQEHKKMEESIAHLGINSQNEISAFCEKFLLSVYDGKYESVWLSMDTLFTGSLSKEQAQKGIFNVTQRMRGAFGDRIKVSLVAIENTFHEKLPTKFVIVKAESSKIFGYYFFYLSEISNKVLLFSEFNRTKEKRLVP
jgi:hypothetical protein